MGLPDTERGGPPGGGGMGRPEALVGACVGADGGEGGAPAAGADGLGAAGAGGRGAVGATGAAATGAGRGADGGAVAGAGADGAAAGATGGVDGEAAGGADAAGATGVGATGATGAGVIGDGARAGAGALGCSDAGRLVISRAPERLTGAGEGARGSPPPDCSPAPASGGVVWSGPGVSVTAGVVDTALAAFFVAAAFLAGGAGSSGCTGRRRPSRSAFLRARSAWASSMDDEWLLTPIPRDKQRSSASLLVRPSS